MPTPISDLFPAALLRAELQALGLEAHEAASLQTIRHRRIMEAVLDGVIPGAAFSNGRWYFQRSALPAIKTALLALAAGRSVSTSAVAA